MVIADRSWRKRQTVIGTDTDDCRRAFARPKTHEGVAPTASRFEKEAMKRLLFCIAFVAFSILVIPQVAWADDTIYSKVDESPVPLKTPPPRYPLSLKLQRIEGLVAVAIVIDEHGSVINGTIVKSSHKDFEEPALEAVKGWKFRPGKKEGVAVKVRVTAPLRFKVED